MVGFYQSFVQGFSKIAFLRTKLLHKTVPFEWGNDQEEAFRYLSSTLGDAPVLRFPDFEQLFAIYTDTSNHAVGAVLMQDHRAKVHLTAFFSKQSNFVQLSYAVTEKKAVSIILALKDFQPYISVYHVTIYTDHQPLAGLLKGNYYTA